MEHTCFLLILILAFHRNPAVVAMSPLFNNLFLPQCVMFCGVEHTVYIRHML